MNPKSLLKTILLEAGNILRGSIGKVGYRYKGFKNLLTETDLKSENLVRGKILKNFPDHGILSEETAPKISSSPYLWVIDPLDGTTNFAHSFPVACVSIALLKNEDPVLGGIYDPFRDELFMAEKGRGAFLNGKRIKVSSVKRLEESLVMTGFPLEPHFEGYLRLYRKFLRICHDLRRSGSAALDLAWTACGRLEGYWEFKLNPWDVAAGKLILEEAGGKMTDFRGRPWKGVSNFGRETTASNGKIHRQMLKIIGVKS